MKKLFTLFLLSFFISSALFASQQKDNADKKEIVANNLKDIEKIEKEERDRSSTKV